MVLYNRPIIDPLGSPLLDDVFLEQFLRTVANSTFNCISHQISNSFINFTNVTFRH